MTPNQPGADGIEEVESLDAEDEPIDDAGDDIVVTVRDNGVGVSEERIAEAGSRGRLGVSASIRGRLEELGGSARYLYGPGGGTTVEMWIPKRGG